MSDKFIIKSSVNYYNIFFWNTINYKMIIFKASYKTPCKSYYKSNVQCNSNKVVWDNTCTGIFQNCMNYIQKYIQMGVNSLWIICWYKSNTNALQKHDACIIAELSHWLIIYWNSNTSNIVAAFWGMHVLPAKHSYEWLPRKCDYRTDRQTPDKMIPMCSYALQATQ